MPVCKICDEVVSALEIKNGVCQRCLSVYGESSKVKKSQKKSSKYSKKIEDLTNMLIGFVVFFIIFIVLMAIASSCETSNKQTIEAHQEKIDTPIHQKIMSADQKLHKQVDWQFDTWSGEHKELTKYIKRGLKYPNTFNQEQIRVFPSGKDHFIINIIYSAKNSYGMVVKKYISAKITIDGTKITIKEEYGL